MYVCIRIRIRIWIRICICICICMYVYIYNEGTSATGNMLARLFWLGLLCTLIVLSGVRGHGQRQHTAPPVIILKLLLYAFPYYSDQSCPSYQYATNSTIMLLRARRARFVFLFWGGGATGCAWRSRRTPSSSSSHAATTNTILPQHAMSASQTRAWVALAQYCNSRLLFFTRGEWTKVSKLPWMMRT